MVTSKFIPMLSATQVHARKSIERSNSLNPAMARFLALAHAGRLKLTPSPFAEHLLDRQRILLVRQAAFTGSIAGVPKPEITGLTRRGERFMKAVTTEAAWAAIEPKIRDAASFDQIMVVVDGSVEPPTPETLQE